MANKYSGLEVAVIGMAGRFPGANDIKTFWDNLAKGKESIQFFSEEELRDSGVDQQVLDDSKYVRAGSYLKDKEYFDAAFFGYRADEARVMDPQLRLFHECVWSAIEDAGYKLKDDNGKIGLFAGANPNLNWQLYSTLLNQKEALVDPYSLGHLNNVNFLTNRVSYLLDLKGPSVFVNTTCSTSLAAIHMACNSLLLRECKMALAGGVTIKNQSKNGYLYQEGMINSKDGHCRAFDDDSSGTVGGEGLGVVLLKRLSDAIKDGDHIYAIVKGSGMNNDGNQKVGFTAPSVQGQAEAIQMAHALAKVPADSMGYLEAHGTGTRLGDPIEIDALNAAFGKLEPGSCALGSVKTNIGHLDAAAGIAGFIKAVMAIHHAQLPPSLNFNSPNQEINFEEGPFYVNTSLKEWSDQPVRRAGVSSFGIGGTNVHLILEEAPVTTVPNYCDQSELLVFSAKTEEALNKNRVAIREFLANAENVPLAMRDVAYTLATGRQQFEFSQTFAVNNKEDALEKMKSSEGVTRTGEKDSRVVFLFPGQGSQYPAMCKDLYDQHSKFRQIVDQCFALAASNGRPDLKEILFDSKDANAINQTANTQPLIFIVEYALAKLLMNWGCIPQAMIGHSIGEIVAATISEVLTLEDAIKLIIKRGELIQQVAPGSMLAIDTSEAEANELIRPYEGLSVAAINTATRVVISGRDEAINALQEALDNKEVPYKKLFTSHAFHSAMMESMLGEFQQVVEEIEVAQPKIPYLSNLSGQFVTNEVLDDRKYWAKHIRETVRFYDCVETLLDQPDNLLIEVGPGNSLTSFVKSIAPDSQVGSLVRHPKKSINDLEQLMTGLGDLWARGLSIDWQAFYEGREARRISLPTYSFDKTEFPTMVDATDLLSNLGVTEAKPSNDIRYYQQEWKRTSLNLKPTSKGSDLILFMEDPEANKSLLTQLRSRGIKVVAAERGTDFRELEPHHFRFDFNSEYHLSRFFSYLEEHGLDFSQIHVLTSSQLNHKLLKDEGHMSPVFVLTDMIRKIVDQLGVNKEISIVTDQEYLVTGAEEVKLGIPGLESLAIVMRQEYPGLKLRLIDTDSDEKNNRRFDETLIVELTRGTGNAICLRNGLRWEKTFEICEDEDTESVDFDENSLILITGGLGKVGFQLAKQLLRDHGVSLLLVGKSDLEKDATKADRFRLLQDLGQVTYARVDISNLKSARNILLPLEEELGKITGIIHAAGQLNNPASVAQLNEHDLFHQAQPKLQGVKVLDQIFAERPLQCCLAISSLSTVLGGIGLGSYAAANETMERSGIVNGKLPWKVINFDGIATESAENATLIDSNEVYKAMMGIISRSENQVFVTKNDLEAERAKWLKVAIEEEEIVETREPFSNAGTVLAQLQRLWIQFFSLSEVTPDQDFFDLGGDSLQALTMIARIQKLFGVSVPVDEFFKHTRISALARFIEHNQTEKQSSNEIPVATKAEHYPTSPNQQRLHYLQLFDFNSTAYNLPKLIKLEGHLDLNRLEDAFKQLILRHEPLRTYFVVEEGVPVQKIHEVVDFEIECFNASENDVEDFFSSFVQPFDLTNEPLIRVGVMRIEKSVHMLMIDMHHIITDGVSHGILVNDFMSIYEGRELEPIQVQFKDYTSFLEEDEMKTLLEDQKSFWTNSLSEPRETLELPMDFERPANPNFEGNAVHAEISGNLFTSLKEVAQEENSTLFNVVFSLVNILMAKLGDTEDVIIGNGVSGRQHPDVQNMLGMFVNTLPLRTNPKRNLKFSQFLGNIKETTHQALNHQSYPLDRIISDLGIETEQVRNPLFDVVFVYQRFDQANLNIPGLKLTPVLTDSQSAKFDLTIEVVEREDRLVLNFEYATALFKEDTVRRFVSYFEKIAEEITANVHVQIENIDMLSSQETNLLLHELNDTTIDYPRDITVPELFQEQVSKFPEKVAVVMENDSLTYQELDVQTDRLAAYLVNSGIQQGNFVGVYGKRTISSLISILAILKAGGAYVPLDPEFPIERTQRMLELSDAKCVIAANEHIPEAISSDYPVIDSEVQVDTIDLSGVSRNAKDLAYVMFTSGTTGVPKGVMIRHFNIISLISNPDYVPLNEETRILLAGAMVFDATTFEIWGSLLNGGTVYLADKSTLTDTRKFNDVLKKHEINTMFITTSLFNHHLEHDIKAFSPLSHLLVGGDVMNPTLTNQFREANPKVKVSNIYGPTENTTFSLSYPVTEHFNSSIPIGKPNNNTTAYILGKQGELLPSGAIGELYLGGEGLAAGYLGDSELSNSKFVDHPFEANQKLYRTGDLARWAPGGNVEFVGRVDKQIKLRGYRIELSEIQMRMTEMNQITDAVVIAVNRGSEKVLVAYYTGKAELMPAHIRNYLIKSLPDYMVPVSFNYLDKIPLNINGKLDKAALPEPNLQSKAYVAPQTETEIQLVNIWAEILDMEPEKISVNENFFELGGNSLSAVKLLNKIETAFGENLTLKKLFEVSGIEDLAALLSIAKNNVLENVSGDEVDEFTF